MPVARRWADIKRGRVSRKAYAKLLLRCVLRGDFGSLSFLARRVIVGDQHGR